MTTKTKQAHTPTPWEKVGDFGIKEVDKQTVWIADLDPDSNEYGDVNEAKANASFIVKAVNCHEELLESLKEVLNCFHSTPPTLTVEILYKADKIIKKAEAE